LRTCCAESLPAVGQRVSSLDFNPDGTRPIASIRSLNEGTGTAVILDTTTWDPVAQLGVSDRRGATTAVYSPAGELVTVGADGSITVRDPDTLEPRTLLESGAEAADIGVLGPFVSADSQYLLTMRYGSPRLWHLPSGTLLGSFPKEPTVSVGGAAGAEHLQLVTSSDEYALVWNLDVDSWLDTACGAAGRNLTLEEWQRYGPEEVPYQATCPQWPA
jgi:WD40 repeat protein